jgi:UDP-glucose 4-epimerase
VHGDADDAHRENIKRCRLKLNGQRVLITGGLGFIGSNLAKACLAAGASVTIYDCLDPHSGGNMHNISEFEHDVEVVLNDIRNFEGVCAAVRGKDILFSCAAFTSHPNSMKEPLIDIDVNCKGVINLLEAARRFNPKMKIVHVGTSTQIGRMVHEVVDENHPEFPIDIYSANKSASEKYVLCYAHAYKLPGTVVRLANVYGPRSNIKSPEFGFVNYFVGLGLKGKDITVDGEGHQRRNLSYVGDVVNALIAAAGTAASDGKVFFAASNDQLTVRQIADAIAATVGGKIRQVEWPKDRAAIEVGDAVISNALITKTLGWEPRTDLASGMKATKAYFGPCVEQYL